MSDLIDREYAYDAIEAMSLKYDISPSWKDNRTENEKRSDWFDMFKALAMQAIRKAPSVQPVRKGKWEEAWRSGFDGVRNWHWECSECGFELNFDGCIDPNETLSMYNYCPNCGAMMSEGEEDA